MTKNWTQQTLAEELQERVSQLEQTLASYQTCRVNDVDEKAWLSARMSYFEGQLRSLLSSAAFEAILSTAPNRSVKP